MTVTLKPGWKFLNISYKWKTACSASSITCLSTPHTTVTTKWQNPPLSTPSRRVSLSPGHWHASTATRPEPKSLKPWVTVLLKTTQPFKLFMHTRSRSWSSQSVSQLWVAASAAACHRRTKRPKRLILTFILALLPWNRPCSCCSHTHLWKARWT